LGRIARWRRDYGLFHSRLSGKEWESGRARERGKSPCFSLSCSLALPLLFRFSRYRRVTLGAAAVPGRLWPGRQDSSGRRHARELSSTPQPLFPVYCLSFSSLGRNCAAEPRLYQRSFRIWTSPSKTPFNQDSVTTTYISESRVTQAITVEMLLNHRDTLRSPEGHKQRALTLSRFALRAARQITRIRHMANTFNHFLF
jgi:hypothetical protein